MAENYGYSLNIVIGLETTSITVSTAH